MVVRIAIAVTIVPVGSLASAQEIQVGDFTEVGNAAAKDTRANYGNFFQPSFKLKSKTRVGARVSKVYHAPLTPYSRLLASDQIPNSVKDEQRVQFASLDPHRLLREIRQLQGELVASEQTKQPEPHRAADEVTAFVRSLSTAWREGEIRPTHRKPVRPPRTWRTRRDPFEEVWPAVLERLGEVRT